MFDIRQYINWVVSGEQPGWKLSQLDRDDALAWMEKFKAWDEEKRGYACALMEALYWAEEGQHASNN